MVAIGPCCEVYIYIILVRVLVGFVEPGPPSPVYLDVGLADGIAGGINLDPGVCGIAEFIAVPPKRPGVSLNSFLASVLLRFHGCVFCG